jgi:hypothetical protein
MEKARVVEREEGEMGPAETESLREKEEGVSGLSETESLPEKEEGVSGGRTTVPRTRWEKVGGGRICDC